MPTLYCRGSSVSVRARYLVAVGAHFALYIDAEGIDTLFMLAHQL